jgi:hypothetical protein
MCSYLLNREGKGRLQLQGFSAVYHIVPLPPPCRPPWLALAGAGVHVHYSTSQQINVLRLRETEGEGYILHSRQSQLVERGGRVRTRKRRHQKTLGLLSYMPSPSERVRDGIFKLLRSLGIDSAILCSLAGRYDNPVPTWLLAPIDYYKIPALDFRVMN